MLAAGGIPGSVPARGVVGREAFGEGTGIFAEDRDARDAEDFAGAFVIAGLDAGMIGDGVHHVGLHEDDRAVVEPVGEEVP